MSHTVNHTLVARDSLAVMAVRVATQCPQFVQLAAMAFRIATQHSQFVQLLAQAQVICHLLHCSLEAPRDHLHGQHL